MSRLIMLLSAALLCAALLAPGPSLALLSNDPESPPSTPRQEAGTATQGAPTPATQGQKAAPIRQTKKLGPVRAIIKK